MLGYVNAPASPHIHQSSPSRDGPWLALASLLVGLVLIGLWRTPERIHHDCVCLLQMGEMLLDGGVPYCDFVDTNPPLIMYLHVPPVLLARTFGISPIIAFHGLVVALLLLSGLEIYLLLRRPRLGLDAGGRGLILLAWIALYFVVDYRGDAGQREHLFVMAYVPYLFLRILRHRGGSVAGWFALLLGIQAGIGVSLKPHFLLAAASAEIALLLLSRRWWTLVRPENAALAAVVAAYLVHWIFVPAAMREAFFHRWLPLLVDRYDAIHISYDRIVDRVFGSLISLIAMAAILIAVLFCLRRRLRLRHHLVALATLAGAALVMVFVQHKGWPYHRLPFELAGLLCLTTLAVAGSRRSAIGSWPWIAIGTVFAAGITVWFTDRDCAWRDSLTSVELRQIVEDRTRPGDRVFVVAFSSRPIHPILLRTGRKPGSRYPWAFPLAFFYAGETPAEMDRPIYHRWHDAPAEEQQYLNDLQDEVVRFQPRLIIIQDESYCASYLPKGFNPFKYLIGSGWAQEVLTPYRKVACPLGWKVLEKRDRFAY